MQTGQRERGLALFSFVSQQPASDQAARAEASRQLHEAKQAAETEALATQANQQAQTLTDVLNKLLSQWGSFDGVPEKEKQAGGG
jgi:hypothetical protein